MPSRGASVRRKGGDFERYLAREFRKLPCLANVEVWRSQQGRDAEQSDVVVPGLWVEAQHANNPTPIGKLLQAEGDKPMVDDRICVAITRKTRSPEAQVTLRARDLVTLLTKRDRLPQHGENPPVTLTLARFLAVYAAAVEDGVITIPASARGAA